MNKPVFLPKTEFSIKANLTEKEPLILKEWQEKRRNTINRNVLIALLVVRVPEGIAP